MNKVKIFAAAAGFALAAGVTIAGNVSINGQHVGTYDSISFNSNGTVTIQGPIELGDTSGPSCGANAVPNSSGTGCVCESGYEYQGVEGGSVPENTNCTLVDDGTDGGDETDPPPAPSNCDGVGVDSTWHRATQYTGFSPFPMPTGERHEYTLRNKNYFAIQFTVPQNSGKYGSIAYDGHPHATNATQTWNISTCPGDFRANSSASPQGACNKVSPSGSFYFGTSDSSLGGAGWLCTLQAGQTYYLNIAYGADPNGGNNLSVTCPSSRCGAYFDFKTN